MNFRAFRLFFPIGYLHHQALQLTPRYQHQQAHTSEATDTTGDAAYDVLGAADDGAPVNPDATP